MASDLSREQGRVKHQRAFTLIELLVVIAIIALLLAILLPALKMVKEQGRKIVCGSHLSGIGKAVFAYLTENDDTFHYGRNNGLWEDWQTGIPYEFTHSFAYWGIAYSQYTDGQKIFNCPSARWVDPWMLPGEQFNGWNESDALKLFEYCDYGLNGYANSYSSAKKKISDFKSPSQVIFCQDHIEQLLDNYNSDMFCGKPNLQQWRGYESSGIYSNVVQHCFRHNRTSIETGKGTALNVWLDGSVSDIDQTDGYEDVPIRWYLGETP